MEDGNSLELFIQNIEFLNSILLPELFRVTLVLEQKVLFIIFVYQTNRYFASLFYFQPQVLAKTYKLALYFIFRLSASNTLICRKL